MPVLGRRSVERKERSFLPAAIVEILDGGGVWVRRLDGVLMNAGAVEAREHFTLFKQPQLVSTSEHNFPSKGPRGVEQPLLDRIEHALHVVLVRRHTDREPSEQVRQLQKLVLPILHGLSAMLHGGLLVDVRLLRAGGGDETWVLALHHRPNSLPREEETQQQPVAGERKSIYRLHIVLLFLLHRRGGRGGRLLPRQCDRALRSHQMLANGKELVTGELCVPWVLRNVFQVQTHGNVL
mmetsp:Transcript_36050/g.74126  ORF Transcript_36050/g.74126 Transcript_36050/m.74126 type:complete len:238 (+) Transcript_36050:966-1679(+)